MIVFDASAAVKLVTREPGSESALARFRSDDERLVPDWLNVEVANALARKVRANKLRSAEAYRALRALGVLFSDQLDSLVLIEHGFDLGVQIGHGVYDCLYLAAAIEHDGVVITADERFAERAAAGGFAARVELLA